MVYYQQVCIVYEKERLKEIAKLTDIYKREINFMEETK